MTTRRTRSSLLRLILAAVLLGQTLSPAEAVARPTAPSKPTAPAIDPDLLPALDGVLPPDFFSTVRLDVADMRPGAPLVVLVQDIHANVEAQTNVSRALLSLDRFARQPVPVGLEGAQGDFLFGRFARLPRRNVARDVADAFLASGDISGPAHAGFVSALDGARSLRFHGVDAERPYRRNLAAYRAARPRQAELKRRLAALAQRIAARKTSLFNARLAAFDAAVTARRDGRLGLGPYFEWVSALGIDLPVEALAFLAVYRDEKSLDLNRVNLERRAFVERLVPRLSADEAAAFAGASSPGATAQRGRQVLDLGRLHGLNPDDFPAFAAYVRQLALTERLKGRSLLAAIDRLEADTFQALAATPAERALLADDARVHQELRLARFELTSAEWDSLRSVAGRDAALRPFEAFYEAAARRNDAMARQLARVAGRAPVSVLVAGGFHTEGLHAALTARGFSCVVVTPRVARADARAASAYLSYFDREKTALDRLFDGPRLLLAHPVAGAAHPLAGADSALERMALYAALLSADGADGVRSRAETAFVARALGLPLRRWTIAVRNGVTRATLDFPGGRIRAAIGRGESAPPAGEAAGVRRFGARTVAVAVERPLADRASARWREGSPRRAARAFRAGGGLALVPARLVPLVGSGFLRFLRKWVTLHWEIVYAVPGLNFVVHQALVRRGIASPVPHDVPVTGAGLAALFIAAHMSGPIVLAGVVLWTLSAAYLYSRAHLAVAVPFRNPVLAENYNGVVAGYGDPAVIDLRYGHIRRLRSAWRSKLYETLIRYVLRSPSPRYVLTATSNEAANALPLLVSNDLVSWTPLRASNAPDAPGRWIFPAGKKPAWTDASDRGDFWAPEIHDFGDGYMLLYTGREAARHPGLRDDRRNRLCIGAAYADDPRGEWTDLGRPLVSVDGVGVIDAHLLSDEETGKTFLFFKIDGNGLHEWKISDRIEELKKIGYLTVTLRIFDRETEMKVPIVGNKAATVFVGQEVRFNGHDGSFPLELIGDPVDILRNDQAWEGEIVEGMWMIHARDERGRPWYYLFYAGNDYEKPDYAIGVARSESPLGPFEKFTGGPLLQFRRDAGPTTAAGATASADAAHGVTGALAREENGGGGPFEPARIRLVRRVLARVTDAVGRMRTKPQPDPSGWSAAGHPSVVKAPDGHWYIVYHAYAPGDAGGYNHPRWVFIDRVDFRDGWPRINEGTPGFRPALMLILEKWIPLFFVCELLVLAPLLPALVTGQLSLEMAAAGGALYVLLHSLYDNVIAPWLGTEPANLRPTGSVPGNLPPIIGRDGGASMPSGSDDVTPVPGPLSRLRVFLTAARGRPVSLEGTLVGADARSGAGTAEALHVGEDPRRVEEDLSNLRRALLAAARRNADGKPTDVLAVVHGGGALRARVDALLAGPDVRGHAAAVAAEALPADAEGCRTYNDAIRAAVDDAGDTRLLPVLRRLAADEAGDLTFVTVSRMPDAFRATGALRLIWQVFTGAGADWVDITSRLNAARLTARNA